MREIVVSGLKPERDSATAPIWKPTCAGASC